MRLPCAFAIVLAFTALHSAARSAPLRQAGQFQVMTFNVQHGMTAAGVYDLSRAAAVIAAVHPDLVGLQETTRNHPKYGCDDQPKVLADAIGRATGHTWNVVYEQEWFTPDTTCRDSGRGDGKETEGLTVLSPNALEKVSHANLWNTRLGLVARTSATGRVPIVVTHLGSGNSDRQKRDRIKQLDQLFGWAEGLGTPRIVIGDFNVQAGSDEYRALQRGYHDAWADASAAGNARGPRDGFTRADKPGRIDYVLYAPSSSLTLESVEVVDTKALVGTVASDHLPVVATFRVK